LIGGIFTEMENVQLLMCDIGVTNRMKVVTIYSNDRCTNLFMWESLDLAVMSYLLLKFLKLALMDTL